MKLWQDYSNAKTSLQTNELENRLVEQYKPLVSRVWRMNFRSRDYEESFAQGMVSLWEAIKKWKDEDKIGIKSEKDFLNFAGASIRNGMANYWRNQSSQKRTFASSNSEAFELVGEESNNLSEETRSEEARQEIEKLLGQQQAKTYEALLARYGHGESWEDLWQDAGYSSSASMRQAMNESIHRLRKKAKEAEAA